MTFRNYEHVVAWDLQKAYNTVKTGEEEMHMRRLLWRFSEEEPRKTFGFLVMAFGDRPAATGMEVAKRKVVEMGADIDEEAVKMMQLGTYVDDETAGGSPEDLERMVGDVTEVDGEYHYSGTIAQIYKKGGFRVKVMVRSGEGDKKVTAKLGGGVLGLLGTPRRKK